MPSGVVTEAATAPTPAYAPVVQVSDAPPLATTTPVQATPPSMTLVAPVSRAPASVTSVPPPAGPVAGVIEVTAGATNVQDAEPGAEPKSAGHGMQSAMLVALNSASFSTLNPELGAS